MLDGLETTGLNTSKENCGWISGCLIGDEAQTVSTLHILIHTKATWGDMSCHDNSDTVMTETTTMDETKKKKKREKVTGVTEGLAIWEREDTAWERECQQGKPTSVLTCSIISHHPSCLAQEKFVFLCVWHSRAPLYTPLQYRWWHD